MAFYFHERKTEKLQPPKSTCKFFARLERQREKLGTKIRKSRVRLGTSIKSKMADLRRVFSLFFLAFISRIFLIYSPVKDWFINRIELSTPLNAWNRVNLCLKITITNFQDERQVVVKKWAITKRLFETVTVVETIKST